MHICFATIDSHKKSGGGGIASYVETIGQAFTALGHEVSVISKARKNNIQIINGIKHIEIPMGNLHYYLHKLKIPARLELVIRELEWSLALKRQVQRLNKEESIDILEGCETGITFLNPKTPDWPPLIVRLHGEPYVFSKYSGEKLGFGAILKHKMELAALNRASGITSPSEFQANEISQELREHKKTIKVIPNPIHPIFLEKARGFKRNWHKIDDDPIILYTGRIEYRKGTLTLLQSIKTVDKNVRNFQYIIAGGRHPSISDNVMNSYINNDEYCHRFTLLGHMPWLDLINWYKKASIFVLPSYYETFGISAIEAMAFGLPVVGTTGGGLPEVVVDGITGILVPPGDDKSLGEAIVELLRDPNKRKVMGEAGKERVLAEFTAENIAHKTLEYYQKIICNS